MIKLNNRMRWAVSAFFATLILFGTYHAVFSIVAFLGVCLLLCVCERESILLQLFFIMPMANIFKMSPSSQSFFTIILLIYVVIYFILPRKATLLIVLFSVYIVVGQLVSGTFLLFRTIKLICNILFLSSILNHKVNINHKNIFFSYIIGNIVASCMGLMDSNFFRIKNYVGEEEIGGVDFLGLTRFTGLHTDPNYYTVGLIISLCLIVVLYHRKEIKTSVAVLFTGPIIYFLILTYSKSAILMLFLPLAYLLYSLFKQRKLISILVILASASFVFLLATTGKIEALNIVMMRFNAIDTSEGVDVNALTTGRFDIWIVYSKYLVKDFFAMIFGKSISASPLNGHVPHNTYLDLWYYLGTLGSTIFISALYLVLRQSKRKAFKRNLLNYSVLISMLLLYFSLSELFYFDVPFHFFLAFTVVNLQISSTENSSKLIAD